MSPLVRFTYTGSGVWVQPESVIAVALTNDDGKIITMIRTTLSHSDGHGRYRIDQTPDEAAELINRALTGSPFEGTPV